MPLIRIDGVRCKGCGLCTTVCNARLISLGDTPNSLGYNVAVFKESSGCTGCTLCAQICPDLAITVFKE